MKPTGSDRPLAYILGEAPGREEDEQNKQFVGRSGKILRARLPSDLLPKLRFNNCARTRPKDNKTPDRIVLECCRPSVEADIAATKPKAIWGFGNVALQWASGFSGIGDWRGRRFPVEIAGHACWFYPIAHPAYILRKRRSWAENKGADVIGSEDERAFVLDIERAVAELNHLPTPEVHNREIAEYGLELYDGNTPKQIESLRKAFAWAKKEELVGLDYETNAIRPYKDGSKILTAAIGTPERSFAFALDHSQAGWTKTERQEIGALWVDFLKAPTIKAVHHLPFEMEWTAVKFGKELLRASRWEDTLTQASTLDERKSSKQKRVAGPLSLDFLCKQYFGLNLKSLTQLNKAKLDQEPVLEVLRYNAMDAKYHCLLYKAQRMRIVDQGLLKVYNRSRRRIPTCVLTQVKGMYIDQDETKRLEKKYTSAITKIEKDIAALDCVVQFKSKYKHDFNPRSNSDEGDVVLMLRDVLKRKEGYELGAKDRRQAGKEGKSIEGKYSTKKEILARIDHPIAALITKIRNIDKKLSTFCYKDVWPDGLLHPIFNHGPRTVSHRISCEEPNLQQIPKRDQGNREVRKQFRAPDGRIIVAIDYGQIEARVIAMASKDKAFVKSLWERHDVHEDWARIIAHAYPRRIGGKKFLNDKETMKDFRTDIKNQWTFPLFFGAQLESVAEYLKMPVEEIQGPFKQFKKEFSGVFNWQETLMDFYYKHGYVENMLGRRRRAPMSKNEIINTPIQSTACEIVMDGMNRLSEMATSTGDDNFQPNINIHDDLTFVPLEEKVDYYLEKIIPEMLNVKFPFINVPLTLEVAIGMNLMPFDEKNPDLNPEGMREIFKASSDDWV